MGGFILGLLLAVGILSATPDYDSFSDDTVLVEIVRTETGRKLGHGSGAVLENGNILTAGHISDYAAKHPEKYHLKVTYRDGSTTIANVAKQAWTRSPYINEDLGLLVPKNPTRDFNGAPVDCDQVKPGREVYVSGNPSVMRWTVTDGRVMGKNPRIKLDEGTDGSQWLQIDGTVIGGNSGGPVFTRDGHIVGIVSHGIVQGYSPVGLNFAVSGPVICNFLGIEEDESIDEIRRGRK